VSHISDAATGSRARITLVVFVFVMLLGSVALGQAWPASRPVAAEPTNTQPILAWAGQRIVLEHDWSFTDINGTRTCPFAPGGESDFYVRYLIQALSPGTLSSVPNAAPAAAAGPDYIIVPVSPNDDCISRVIYESQDQSRVDVTAHVVECTSGSGGIDPDTCTIVSDQVPFLAFYMKLEDVQLTLVPGSRSGLNSGTFEATNTPVLSIGDNGLPTPNDITSTTADVSQDVLARIRVRGWVLTDNCPARNSDLDSNGGVLPANRCIFPDDWRHIAGGDLAEALHPNYDVWGATPTCTNVAGPFSQLDGPLCGDSLAPYAPVGDGQRETYFPDGVVNAGDAPMPLSLVRLLLTGAGSIRPADKGDIYDPVTANNQFYDTHIPAEPWIPPINSELSGYQWNSWGTGPKSGLYHSWTSLADSGPPIVSGGAASGGYGMIKIYSDDHGEAMAWLSGDANLAAGTSTLTAQADYPDKLKHVALASNDVTVAWTGTVSAATGGTVSTGSAATSSDPLVTSVTVPPGTAGGTVSISEQPITTAAPSGFSLLDQQVVITAPDATPGNPLVLVFRIDSTILGGANKDNLQIFKNGGPDPVLNCLGSTIANPDDPCVSNRAVLDGGVEITVLTSTASIWNFGVAASVPHDAVMSKFDTGTKDIHLGSRGMKVRDVTAHCQNKTSTEMIRCTVQISELPAGCTAQSSGHDKMFDSGGDDRIVSSPGGFLLDDTSGYAKSQDKKFDFKLKVTCAPPITSPTFPAIVMFEGCADGGSIDRNNPCSDNDDTHSTHNVRVRFNRLLK
jgi:hypothetical protein